MRKPKWFGGSQKEFNEMMFNRVNEPLEWERPFCNKDKFIFSLCQPRYNPKMTKEQKVALKEMENDKVNYSIHDWFGESGIKY